MRMIVILMAAIILIATAAWAAAKATGPRVYASRAVGTVMHNGEAQSGLIVVRIVTTREAEQRQEARTDHDGVFRFPELTGLRNPSDFLPGGVLISQDIRVLLPGGGHKSIWSATKSDFERNTEIGRPIDLRCNLEKEVAGAGKPGSCFAKKRKVPR